MAFERVQIVTWALVLFLCVGALGAVEVTPAEKQRLFSLESEILSLLKERHVLAGEAIELRVKLLEAKKRAVPENAEEVRKELSLIGAGLKEKNLQIEAKNELIRSKTAELKALVPGAGTKATKDLKRTKKKRPVSSKR